MACKSKHQGESERVNEDQFDETRFLVFLDLLDHIGSMIVLEALGDLKSTPTREQECDEKPEAIAKDTEVKE